MEGFLDGGVVGEGGAGESVGIDLAGEVSGILRVPGDDGWDEERFAFNTFGQGFSTSPLQMAVAMATLANDGRRMQPFLLASRMPPIALSAQPYSSAIF